MITKHFDMLCRLFYSISNCAYIFVTQITLSTIFLDQSESKSSMVKRKSGATNVNVSNRH